MVRAIQADSRRSRAAQADVPSVRFLKLGFAQAALGGTDGFILAV